MTDPAIITEEGRVTARSDVPKHLQLGGPWHILAASCPADEHTRVLKHGDTFAVFDHYGDIKPGGLGEEGLYHESTRFLSCLLLELEGSRPFFLNSTLLDGNDQLTITLTNPDQLCDGRVRMPLGTLYLTLRKFLWRGVCYQEVRIKNHGLEPVDTALTLHFAADYADIFEVRGLKRQARGEDLPPEVTQDSVRLGYRGLDGIVRRTRLDFTPSPALLSASTARLDVRLWPRQEVTFSLTIACERESKIGRLPTFDAARAEAEKEWERARAWSCRLRTGNGQFNAWLDRAASDLHMLTTELPTGPYPYAGLPWFNAPFGRDGIITALECLWLWPGLARGVLAYLASTQATGVAPEQDAEPGKILHETRCGEMASLGEMPFGRYYGSADATPLFVMLAGAYYLRTGDRGLVEGLWPHVEAALAWIDRYGDRDGDGFVEYQRQSLNGLLHQGWKDSDDAVFHADGSLAQGPIALCEVQGYVYAARRAGAALAAVLGLTERAAELERQAAALQERFDEAFWCEELSTYALALDGDKRPCRVRTSNAGHCLFTGITPNDRALRVAQTLLDSGSYSGWGIQTVASREVRHNPMSYHNGAVWPHDNAMIAQGLARYGLGTKAMQLLAGLFEASLHFDMHRIPELFCGFARQPGEGPVPYPVACAPQAWSAASAFLLLQASLGLSVDALSGQVSLINPCLPSWLGEVRIYNLEVAGATLDLMLVSHDHDVRVSVLRGEGDVRVTVAN